MASAYAKQSPKFKPAGWRLAEVMESLPGEVRLLHGHRFNHDTRAAKQRIALLEYFDAELPLDDDDSSMNFQQTYGSGSCG